ncbi:MAG: VCBS repeat-containing protein [Flavobacteriaceae bacterium]
MKMVKDSGINFNNRITTNETVNLLNFQYCYNGGGVGIGDFNNDGLPDVYLSGNQVSGRLYLNLSAFKFKDITESSNLNTDAWLNGVTVVDINSDGWEDLYLNVGGADCNNDCKNLLFVNQGLDDDGIPYFEEQAKAYGLDEGGYSQQTVFFDYDNDGDLDAYILTNGNVRFDKNSPMPKRYFPNELRDIFLENNFNDSLNHVFFTDRTKQSGILQKGFGLGLGIHDFDNNGLIDIYTGNDFITNDILYMNYRNEDGSFSFKDQASKYLKHQTFNSMGLDIADLNQDNIPEIMVLDMLPEDYKRQKEMLGSMNYDKFELALKNDYIPQYMHNTLQLSQGAKPNGDLVFSEVSFQTNVAKTDWSWAPLFADYDLDGDLDLYITNGYGKDITNLDFINYSKQNNVFGTQETRNAQLKKLIDELEAVELANYYFESKGGTRFEKKDLFPAQKSLSNGAAYADLDLDGDLDMIVNNINQEAFVFENTIEQTKPNFLKVKLQGTKQNPFAIGAKITLWNQGVKQSHFQSRIRGYLSSVELGAFFGIKTPTIDSLEIIWPDGKTNRFFKVEGNRTLTLNIEKSLSKQAHDSIKTLLENKSELLPYVHLENKSNDYLKQPLLNTQHSKFGPALATGTSTKGGKNLLFIGGSHGEKSQIWEQNKKGTFTLIDQLEGEAYEDTDAVFVDLDNDNDLDLIVTSGGNQYPKGHELYQNRIYWNENNTFLKSPIQMDLLQNNSCIRISDFNKDGHPDFFFGSNIVPLNYPSIPKQSLVSWVDNKFVSLKVEGLEEIGMVKDAIWVDYNNDDWQDLVIVGDWMEISFFKNENGNLSRDTAQILDQEGNTLLTHGWWNSIASGDFDHDGDQDFIIGNKGLNNFTNPTQEEPIYIFTEDYDTNGSIDPIMAAYAKRENTKALYPLQSRDDIMRQLPKLKKDFQSYNDFSKADFISLLNIDELDKKTLKVTTSASVIIENIGENKFKLIQLPEACQVAPINDILIQDFNGDQNLDVYLVGNDYTAEAIYGRYDAFYGLLLEGTPSMSFKTLSLAQSGFYVPYQSNTIVALKNNSQSTIVVGQNNNKLQLFEYIFQNE